VGGRLFIWPEYLPSGHVQRVRVLHSDRDQGPSPDGLHEVKYDGYRLRLERPRDGIVRRVGNGGRATGDRPDARARHRDTSVHARPLSAGLHGLGRPASGEVRPHVGCHRNFRATQFGPSAIRRCSCCLDTLAAIGLILRSRDSRSIVIADHPWQTSMSWLDEPGRLCPGYSHSQQAETCINVGCGS
jgi:hypothetical protein